MDSPRYLLVSICCLVGGLSVALTLGSVKLLSKHPGSNFRGEPFPSGYRYAPGQISFMCKDPSTPEGMIFRASLLVGAICLLVSNYTWTMKNVYFSTWKAQTVAKSEALLDGGQLTRKFCGLKCSAEAFLFWRHVFPAVSMMLVVLVHLPFDQPDHESNLGNQMQNGVHSISAVGLFLGYPLFELMSLLYGNFENELNKCEKKLRLSFAILSLVCMVGFMIPYNMVSNADGLKQYGFCCNDQWRVPTINDAVIARQNGRFGTMVDDYNHNETGVKMLFDTASGPVRFCKWLAFIFEVVDGAALGGSLLTIWWFCPRS